MSDDDIVKLPMVKLSEPPIIELRVVNIMNNDGVITHHVLEYRRLGMDTWEEVPVIYRGDE